MILEFKTIFYVEKASAVALLSRVHIIKNALKNYEINNANKPDIDKLIKDSLAEMEASKNLKLEDFDISPEGAERLLKKLDELEAFALKTKEMLNKKEN